MTGLSPWMDAGGKHLAEEEDEGVAEEELQ
jgi:hypothetical protein